MTFTPVKTPYILQRAFPNMVWHIPNSERCIYLTFDDGPTPKITDWTLDLLSEYNAEATFFCIGKNIELHPGIFKRIIEKGHGIGNHTHNHIKGWNTSSKAYLDDIDKASHYMTSDLFRPPYGQITPKQAKLISKNGSRVVMWNILSLDWNQNISKEVCANNVIKHTTSGDIIVFHDSIKASKNMQYALPKVLDYFSEKGYSFKRIPELSQ